jgi:hypothetical protein
MRKVELGQYSRLFVTAQVTGWLRSLAVRWTLTRCLRLTPVDGFAIKRSASDYVIIANNA